MRGIKFLGDGDGEMDPDAVHLDGIGPDYTLCGMTLDGDPETAGSWVSVEAKKITCPECVEIIKHCRGVKV